jgi:hypothetical protein
VTLDASGIAKTSAAVSVGASAALSAAFTPMSTAYLASATTGTATVDGTDSQAGSISIALTVPPAGSLVVTVVVGTVTLALHHVASNTKPIATGMLQPVTVTENRNYVPGWSATGQASNLTAAGQPVPGTQLGWIPAGTVTGGAELGAPVAPGNPGLGSAGAVLAMASPGAGLGTDTLSAELLLAVPPDAESGPYAGTLTITLVEAGPQSASAAAGLPTTG